MKSYYNSSLNKLHVELKNNYIFDLQLRGRVTIIDGKSATGKTYLTDNIVALVNTGRLSNVRGINGDSNFTIDTLKSIKSSLVVIDNGEYLDDDIVSYICMDRFEHRNTYLIFSRKYLSVGLSPNYYGELVESDKLITVSYPFNEKGWF